MINSDEFVLEGFAERLDMALSTYNDENQEKPLTFAKLAELIGVKYRNIVDWKKGIYRPKDTYLVQIASILNVPLDWLMTGKHSIENDGTSPKELKKEIINYVNAIDDKEALKGIKLSIENIIRILPNIYIKKK